MDYLEAYSARLKRNNDELIQLAKDVILIDPSIEVYHYNGDRFIKSLVFIKDEMINTVSFHEVPYRWSGCNYYKEHGECHSGGENSSMPFDANDVIGSFKPITGVLNRQPNEYFKSKQDYLKWCSYLKRIEL